MPPASESANFNAMSIKEAQLAVLLSGRFAPSTGSQLDPIVWTWTGDELLVYPSSVAVRAINGVILVSIDVACDQTGRTTMTTVLSVGQAAQDDGAGLVAATEALPRGRALIATRWGSMIQGAIWAALLDIVSEQAALRGQLPSRIAAGEGVVLIE